MPLPLSSRPTQGGVEIRFCRTQSKLFALLSPTYRRRYSMKWNILGALIVGICLTGQSYGFGLLDTMLGCGCGCDSCEPQCCCEKSCGCSDDCCDPGCGCDDGCCEASCGCASGGCCKKKHSCFLSRLFKRKSKCCCEASCGCDDGCCGDGCCDDGCCDPGCGCADDCCGDGCCGDGSESSDSDAASASASPIPPAPVADPNARIAQPRKVVSASFVR